MRWRDTVITSERYLIKDPQPDCDVLLALGKSHLQYGRAELKTLGVTRGAEGRMLVGWKQERIAEDGQEG